MVPSFWYELFRPSTSRLNFQASEAFQLALPLQIHYVLLGSVDFFLFSVPSRCDLSVAVIDFIEN